MIVECIDDDFTYRTADGKIMDIPSYMDAPIKGELYEVVDTAYMKHEGNTHLMYILREFPGKRWWHGFFKEVEVNIEELTIELEEPVLA